MMASGTFITYVDIFGENFDFANSVRSSEAFNSDEPFDIISKDDILDIQTSSEIQQNRGSTTTGNLFKIHHNESYNLVPIENSQSRVLAETYNKHEKLCGFLRIHRPADLNKRRRRWFVFSDESCRLLYFKTPHDMIPRCDIDIANASFYIHVDEMECSSKFEIRVKDDTFILEAPDQTTMMYWLQELQKFRRGFGLRKSKSLPLNLSVPGHLQEQRLAESQSPVCGFESVSLPRGTVGDHTRCQPAPASSVIINLREEMRKIMTNIVAKRDTMSSSPGVLQALKTKVSDRTRTIRQRRGGVGATASDTSDDAACRRCVWHEEQLGACRDELVQLDEELQATREITRILQKQLDELARQEQLRTTLELAYDKEDASATLLQQQEKKLLDFEYLLTATQEEKQIISAENRNLSAEVNSLREQIIAYKASLVAKDTVVMTLVSELHEKDLASCSRPGQGNAALITANAPISVVEEQNRKKEVERLQDNVQGYKLQNSFLNQEILELNRLRQESNDMIQEMLQTCVKLETNYYDVHRKYVSCLKELGKVQAEEESSSSLELLQRLIQDAILSSAAAHRVSGSGFRQEAADADSAASNLVDYEGAPTPTRYDKLGFPLSLNLSENDSVNDTLDSLENQSDHLYVKAKSIEHNLSVSLGWERFVANAPLQRAERSEELKRLIRAGVPATVRAQLWKRCVDLITRDVRSGYGDNYYNNLIETIKTSPNLQLNTSSKQIELDLLRTLPGNKNYECIYSGNVPKLRRVLMAYAQHDPLTGYCQGMNRLAAIALLILEEEDAFWCLVAVVNFLLPQGYYSSGMQGAHMDQRVLSDLVQEKLPALHAHFRSLGVDVTLFTFNWFLTAFIDNIPTNTYLRIWDSFLYEGSKVLFRFSLAFLKYKEQELLAVSDSGQLYVAMRKLGEKMIDVNQIAQIAFKDLNPFPMQNITAKRKHHLAVVRAELLKMDQLRQSQRATRPAPKAAS